MVPEAELAQTESGLVPASAGWFVLNAHVARWFHRPGRGDSCPLTGPDEFEAETYFPMLGMSIQVLPPGEPNSTYHWETEQEDFLVLAGEALPIVEGQERRLRQWDFVHCPPDGFYSVDETAARYNASSPEETQDGSLAYARFPPVKETR